MLDVLLDAVIDTLKLLPFLFLSYLLMEFLEHNSSDKARNLLRRSGQIGPLVGSALGVIPQCGFSAAAAGLYTGRIITMGTLIAVFLSTSDEMLPILISEGAPAGFVIKLLATKLVIGIVVGFTVDLLVKAMNKKRSITPEPQIEELCERENCDCHNGFFLSAIKHTLRVTVFILVFSLALNTIIHFIGKDTLSGVIFENSVLGSAISAIVGLIPNCASSVVLTEFYLEGFMSIGSLISGLLVNSGVALALLFRNNRPIKNTLVIVGILLIAGIGAGILIDLTPLSALLKI